MVFYSFSLNYGSYFEHAVHTVVVDRDLMVWWEDS